ncbi:hypothetical protein PABY_19850 [Pyrodictium abyssi]|uniref:Uncharacterized protein n=1 Tax=Pyrodictium abyssi TaxID=54256 RepID=A0ABM8IY08_9CREN|nr:hypothetical protein PABY_19850 [Pyrodictium abyssi]
MGLPRPRPADWAACRPAQRHGGEEAGTGKAGIPSTPYPPCLCSILCGAEP